MREFAVGLLACLAIGGCSVTAGADEQTGTPVPADPAAASGVVFVRTPNLLDARPTEVSAWTPTPAGIAVGFTTGPQSCYGVDATVSETADTVIVELRTGTLPEAFGRACTMNLVYGTLDVPLSSPIGDREVRSLG